MLHHIQLTADSIYTIGDLHGKYGKLFNLINQGVFSNSLIIAVGDFGVGFGGDEVKTLTKLNRRLSKTNTKLFVVRGNHDNPNWFKTTPDKTLKIPKFNNIIFVEDYTVLTVLCGNLQKVNILCVGGATSIDRTARTEGIDWWKDEVFIYDKEKIKEIKENTISIDVICSHAIPHFVYPQTFGSPVQQWLGEDINLKTDLAEERYLVNQLYCDLKDFGLKKWYYGHYHDTYLETINGVRFRLLNINEVEEIRL